MNFLEGSKTYIIVGLMVITSVLYTFELIPTEQFVTIIAILSGGAFATIRHGIKKDMEK